jgi:hypothetical protein
MIKYLANTLEAFPGEPKQIRCFAHIINLVAKCIMKQFDEPKKRNRDNEKDDENGNAAEIELVLQELAEEIEDFEDENECEEEDRRDGHEENGESDGREGMSDEQIHELDENVRPVRLVLAKVYADQAIA